MNRPAIRLDPKNATAFPDRELSHDAGNDHLASFHFARTELSRLDSAIPKL